MERVSVWAGGELRESARGIELYVSAPHTTLTVAEARALAAALCAAATAAEQIAAALQGAAEEHGG